jgi:putative sterol carrier protein
VTARAFFERLDGRVDPEKLAGIDQSFRFEIADEGSWHVLLRDGTVTVTEGGTDSADATVRTSGKVFERIVSGKQNAVMAYMTGKVKVDGDLGAVTKLQKVFS